MVELGATICATIAIYAALRTIFEKNTLLKLPYINVMNFSVAGVIALTLPHPLTIIATITYFVGATLEANAIASAVARLTPEVEP
jgi:energy-converting hydrogenase A subunit C